MERSKLADTPINTRFEGPLVILEAAIKTASNGPYLQMKLSDGEQDIIGKVWKYRKSKVPTQGAVVLIKGLVGEYNGRKDINVDYVEYQPNISTEEFIKRGPNNLENLYKAIYTSVDCTQESICKQITLNILEHYKEVLMKLPAARTMHHNYLGGWLQHTTEVLNLAVKMSLVMTEIGKHQINTSLLICGAVLHDIGKIYTYRFEKAAIEFTDEANFCEHIIAGTNLIHETMIKLNIPESLETLQLKHIIASHHGKLEYGSPVTPVFPEALIIHLADMTSSQSTMMWDAIEKCNAPGWTEKIYPFGYRLYKDESQ